MMTIKQQETIRQHALFAVNYLNSMVAYPLITTPENVFALATHIKTINDVLAEIAKDEESCKQAAA